MMCTACKQHGMFFNHHDSDVCEDCEDKAEAAYAERTDYAYWHANERGNGLKETSE